MRGPTVLAVIGHHALRVLAAVVLTVGLSAVLMLADAAGLLPRQFAAPAARGTHLVPQGNPVIALLSPSSGQGPVGAEITVQGSQWTDADVAVGAATTAANCANPTAGSATGWVATFGTTTQITNGSFTFSFPWPASLSSGGPYTFCAVAAPNGPPNPSGGVASNQTYTVRSAQPPALSLSSSTVQVGQPFTVTGSSFFGAPTVTVTINGMKIQSVQPDGNGSFVVSYTPTVAQVGDDSIQAQTPPEGNAPPVLSATAQIIVSDAPVVTPTPSPSPSPTIEPTTTSAISGQIPGSTSSGGGGGGLIIVLAIAVLLIVALLAGIATFLIMRRRGPGPDYPGAPGGPGDWGGYPGPGRGTGPMPQYGQTAPGRYGATTYFGPGAPYPAQDTYPGTSPQIGGVAQWDDASQMGGGAQWDDPGDSAPGPNWQPRPMSGRRYEDSSYSVPQPPEDTSAGYSPPDPWGGTSAGYGGPPRRPTPPRAAPQPRDDSWDDMSPDQPAQGWNPGGNARGPGGTNPANDT